MLFTTPAPPAMVEVPRDLLESLASDEDCYFDHHGGCQAHGYLSLEQGEECPQHQLRRILAENDEAPAPKGGQ